MIFGVILRVFVHVCVYMFVFLTVSLTAFSQNNLKISFRNIAGRRHSAIVNANDDVHSKKLVYFDKKIAEVNFFPNHKNCVVQNCLKHFGLFFHTVWYRLPGVIKVTFLLHSMRAYTPYRDQN